MKDFQKATEATQYKKVAVFGGAGSGKTILSLSAPGSILIMDTEGGTLPYASLRGFQVVHTQSFGQIKDILDHLVDSPPSEETTLIIDSASLIWTGLQQAMLEKKMGEKGIKAMEGTEKVPFTMADWGVLKKWVKDIHASLMGLKCNVVCTYHENEVRDETTFKGTGVFVAEYEKNTPYVFDYVLRLANRKATFIKGRHTQGGKLVDLTGKVVDIPTVVEGKDLGSIWVALFGVEAEKPTQAHPITPPVAVPLEKDPASLRLAQEIRSKLSPAAGISKEELDLYCMNKFMKDEKTQFAVASPDGKLHLSELPPEKLKWLAGILKSDNTISQIKQRIAALK